MNTKHCTSCSETKSVSDFGIRAASLDGLSAKCKSCQSAYDKARNGNAKRVAQRKAYSLTPQGREAHRRATQRNAVANPMKRYARGVVAYALKCGSLIQQPCEKCFALEAHAHHEDYTKPLLINWLCPKCHKQRHREMSEEGIIP